jgi:hypothetical protein
LICLLDFLYFKVIKESFYLRNREHQGSPISPALFGIFIEGVMQEIKRKCSDGNLRYKLNADDLVFMSPTHHLESLLESLYSVSKCLNLAINAKKPAIFAKKSAIFAITGH